MKINVSSTEVKVRNVSRKRDGKAFTFREQSGTVDLPNGERRVIALSLEEGQAGYAPGVYTLLDASFFVDRNGRLALGRLHLAPLVEAARKSA